LLAAFGCAERATFYKEWYRHVSTREYVALDITSVSSYSEQITECEWGYNRDGENLPQVNICMLFGEETKLPVYQTTYSGSLRDVSTLDATILEFEALTGGANVTLVMDKGFFSAKNIGLLSGNEKRRTYRFIVAVPFTSSFAKEQVRSERKGIDIISNVVFTNSRPIRGVYKIRTWPGGRACPEGYKLHTHIFFNPEKEIKDRNELYGYVAHLKSEAVKDPKNTKLQSEYKKYLIVRKSRRTAEGVTVNIRENVVANELETAGWFILVSNYVDNTQIAHDIYRAKDVVEKSFLKYKCSLGLNRLRVHGDERMQNKLLIAFVALIITSHIHKTMKEKGLFKQMTFERLLLSLGKLKIATLNNVKVMTPPTKELTELLNAFDIAVPTAPGSIPRLRKKRKAGRKPKKQQDYTAQC
jgi:hypothetical protein